jgi:GTP-binding protein
MKFIDSSIIRVVAGRGGDGVVNFATGKGKPRLGPDGGDGGHGGDVVIVGSRALNTLSNYRYLQTMRAEDGGRGDINNRRGKSGKPLLLPVPLGTIILDNGTGETIGEVLEDGEQLIVAKGGLRGLGNTHWATSTHQTPEERRLGGKGEECELRFELKLLADVGLAGFPNAGKSTLLSVVSAARPKIADYPFTTLTPNLGVVDFENGRDNWGRSIVIADVPGLIEGASEGRGLGLEFLKHLERTSVIVYVLDAFEDHENGERMPLEALAILKEELSRYNAELYGRRSLVVLNKIDLLSADFVAELKAQVAELGHEVMAISAALHQGIAELKNRLYQLVDEERAKNPQVIAAEGQAAVEAEDYTKKKPLVTPLERPRGVVTGQTFRIPPRPRLDEGPKDRA